MIQYIAGAGVGGLVLGALLSGWAMSEYKDATWSAETNQLKVEAAEILQKETEKASKIEKDALLKVMELEATHVKEEQTIQDAERRNRALARELGGLRDPGRRASRQDAMPSTPGGTGIPEVSPADEGAISGEASEALLAAAVEVDRLANWANTCYEWKEDVMRRFGAQHEAIETTTTKP